MSKCCLDCGEQELLDTEDPVQYHVYPLSEEKLHSLVDFLCPCGVEVELHEGGVLVKHRRMFV